MNNIKKKLKKILTVDRYNHSIEVAKVAVKLAKIYGIDKDKAKLAGLLHDCAKSMSIDKMRKIINLKNIPKEYDNKSLLHGHAGSLFAQDVLKIHDKDILNAIRYHTTGRKNMTTLEKIIYISDIIEETRKQEFPIDIIRKKAYKNLDSAILEEIDYKINYLLKKRKTIHKNTIELRNELLNKLCK